MKKFFISTFISLTLLFITSTNVYAGSCTSVLNGPSFKAATFHNGPAYSLASDYNTATGARAKTYFYNLYSLSNEFIAWNNRVATIRLMEKDSIFNANDEVKIYKGGFTGRTMTSIVLDSTTMPGNIESVGDNVSELYLNSYFSKHTSDPSIASRGFFDYQLCQE